MKPCPLSRFTTSLKMHIFPSLLLTNFAPSCGMYYILEKLESPFTHLKKKKTIFARRKQNEYEMGKWHRKGENCKN